MTIEVVENGKATKIFSGKVVAVTTDLGAADYVRLQDGDVTHVIERMYLPETMAYWKARMHKRVRIHIQVEDET